MRFADVTEFGMSVIVVSELYAGSYYFVIVHEVEYTLAYDSYTVRYAHKAAFDHRRDDKAGDLIECDRRLVEHLGDDYHRIVACRSDTECQVTGLASHCRYYEPVAAGARIFVKSGSELHTLLFSRVVTESGNACGQGKVVVDSFGNVYVRHVYVTVSKIF